MDRGKTVKIAFIGLMLALAAVDAAAPVEPLGVGVLLPTVEGEFLTGRKAMLPLASAGIVRWLHHGGFEAARAEELGGMLVAIVPTAPERSTHGQ